MDGWVPLDDNGNPKQPSGGWQRLDENGQPVGAPISPPTSSSTAPSFPRGGAVGSPPAPTDNWKPDTSPQHNLDVIHARDAAPWYSQMGTTAGDLMRLGAHGLTGGLNNLALSGIAKLTGGDPTAVLHAREQEDADARTRSGLLGTAADTMGTVFGPGKLMRAEQMAQAAFPYAQGVASQVPGFLGRTAMRMGAGAADNVMLNEANNIGQGKAPYAGALPAAAVGATGSAVVSPALTRIVGAAGNQIPGMTVNTQMRTGGPAGLGRPADAGMDTLYGQKNAAYDALGQHGIYDPAITRQAIQDARTQMTGQFLDTSLGGVHPGANTSINRLEDIANPATVGHGAYWGSGGKAATPIDLEHARNAVMENATTARDKALTLPIDRNLDAVMRDNPTATGQNAYLDVTSARRSNANYKNSALIDTWERDAANAPGRSGSISTAAQGYLKDPSNRALLYPDEQASLESVSRGAAFKRAVDTFAQHPWVLSGALGGGAFSHFLGGGGYGSTLAGTLAYPVASLGAKGISNAMTRNSVEAARRTLTGVGPNITPFSDVLNSATSRDRLTAAMMGLYNQ